MPNSDTTAIPVAQIGTDWHSLARVLRSTGKNVNARSQFSAGHGMAQGHLLVDCGSGNLCRRHAYIDTDRLTTMSAALVPGNPDVIIREVLEN